MPEVAYMTDWLQENEMTCLLNYSPEEQSELQWLANEAAVQHSWAQDSHESMFSSHTGHLKGLQLADCLRDTLWAMSLVRSRTFSEKVECVDKLSINSYAHIGTDQMLLHICTSIFACT